MDTDWCHEEVLQYALELFRENNLPCTVFATGYYASLSRYTGAEFEIGLHPNFNETTIAGYESTLRALRQLYPQAEGVSSHAMTSSTPILNLFTKYGFSYDRNLLCYKIRQAAAFQHYNGLWRVPIFWEDDIWFTVEPGVPFDESLLALERLRCNFNFHPLHLYLNTESPAHYQEFKPLQHQPEALANHVGKGYGARSYFLDLVRYIKKEKIVTGLLKDFVKS